MPPQSDDRIYSKLDEINERTIRLEEQVRTLFERRAEDRRAAGDCAGHASRIGALEESRKTTGSRVWEILVLIFGSAITAWLTSRATK